MQTPPPYIHLASIWHHSHDRCSQAFPVFHHSSTSVYNTGEQNGEGLGKRLHKNICYHVMVTSLKLFRHWLSLSRSHFETIDRLYDLSYKFCIQSVVTVGPPLVIIIMFRNPRGAECSEHEKPRQLSIDSITKVTYWPHFLLNACEETQC